MEDILAGKEGTTVIPREIGFFRELEHGDPHGPSLRDALIDPLPVPTREQVARYLRAGSVVMATTARTRDHFRPETGPVSGMNVMTDGTYVWSEDLAYYVETYGARVPDQVLRLAQAGLPHPLTAEQINAVAQALVPPG
ncbi:MAG: hypothetical protein KJ792_12230 [Actinobacteria bacterium]|nr:hypothetical protein [Actinomycetota bacterium]MCG2803591.1 hypothetical protein [Cellulomonas sp.]